MKLLFLCVQNAGRSQMAAAFARQFAPPGVEIFSAGSRPASRIHPVVDEVMREKGIPLEGLVPQGIDSLPEGAFDLVVGMGCGDACPAARARQVIQWELADPKDRPAEEVRRVRDEIELKVRRLLAGLRPMKLRLWPTLLAGAVFLLCCGLLSAAALLSSPATLVPEPGKALSRVSGRIMQLRAAVETVSPWERRLYRVYDPALGSRREFGLLMDWHKELARLEMDPALLAHIGVLEGETGRLELLKAQTARWNAEAPDPIPAYSGLLQAAYLDAPAETEPQKVFQLLPPGWFRDRLQERLALKQGNLAEAEALRRADREESRRLLERYRALAGLDLAIVALLPLCLLLFVSKPRSSWKAADAAIPLAWPYSGGMAVLVRGAGIGIVLSFAAALLPFSSHPAFVPVSYVLWTLPVFWLAWTRLLRPNRLSLVRETGLAVPPANWGRLALISLLGLGADSLGSWLIGAAGFHLELPSHWAESFDPDLVFGGRKLLLLGLAGTVLAGPFVEELVFRGLFYGTLRAKFRRAGATALSALLFSLVHGYGAVGFFTVFWSGVVFAWVYEESGSLWPAVFAHSAGNLLYSLSLLAMLR